eukprot:3733509-Prymnesium_polylepis.1
MEMKKASAVRQSAGESAIDNTVLPNIRAPARAQSAPPQLAPLRPSGSRLDAASPPSAERLHPAFSLLARASLVWPPAASPVVLHHSPLAAAGD